ncbi:GroES-like protein [Xylaria sp. FL0933]|nr:GroES-like protein [Xylaria sp. FL0933]
MDAKQQFRHAAIRQDESGQPKIVTKAIPPQLLPDTVIIKTIAVALNPSDYKILKNYPLPGAQVGSDFAGTVVDGQEVEGVPGCESPSREPALPPGTMVCGAVPGFSKSARLSNGAFADYVRAPRSLLLRVPTTMPAAGAATLGTALMTCALALWADDALQLSGTPEQPIPPHNRPVPVLVYGGSTATGTVAIQLLRMAGYSPLTTCSQRNAELVRQRGADVVFDRAAPDVAEQIKRYTNGRLEFVLDCIADVDSVTCCYAAIQRPGGRYAALERVPEKLLLKRRAVEAFLVLAPEAIGEGVSLGEKYQRSASQEKRALAVRCMAMFQRLLDDGKLIPHPVQLLDGWLEAIPQGLELLETGSVSGRKLVALRT